MKTFIKNLSVSLAMLLMCLVGSGGTVGAARPTDGWSYVNCTGRWTLATKYQNSSKLTVYMCSNGYAFAQVSSGRKGGVGAYINRSNPYGSQWTWTNNTYASTSPMLYLYKGSCFSAYGVTPDASGSILKHNFCYN